MAKKSKNELIASILYIVVGVLLAIFRHEAIDIAMTIVGVLFIIAGALELIKKNYVGGVISLIIGIAIIVLGWTLAWLVFLILGVLIILKGAMALIGVLKSRKKNALQFVAPVVTILIGVLLACAWGDIANIIVLIAGILLAIAGLLGLIGALKK